MPMTPDELSELKSLIAAARKKPLNFGLCIGKKPDSLIFYLHRKKSPDILMRLAKKAGDTSKVAMGTASVSGKKLTLTIIGDPPSGMAKRTKVFLSAIKMPFKVELLNESGGLIESDGDDDEDQTSADSPAAAKTDSTEPKGPTKEDIADFKEAFAAATAEMARLKKLKVNISAIKTNLAAVAKLAKKNQIEDAMYLLSGLGVKFAAAEQSYCDGKKKKARDAIDLAKTHIGSALEVGKLEVLYKSLEALCDKSPVNPKKIDAIVTAITRKEKQLKRAAKAYRKEYKKILKLLKDDCLDYMDQINDPIVAKEKAIIVAGIALVRQKLAEHSPSLARKLVGKIDGQLYDAITLSETNEKYVKLKAEVLKDLNALIRLQFGCIKGDCTRLAALAKNAATFEGKRAFYDATKIMEQIKAEIPKLKTLGMEQKVFEKAFNALNTQLAIISKSAQFEFVGPEFKALRGKLNGAIKLANKNEFGPAVNIVIGLTTDAKMLEVKAAKSAPFTDFDKDVEKGDIEDLRKQAEALMADLQNHPRAKVAPKLLAGLKASVEGMETAWSKWSDAVARENLKIISGLAAQAKIKLDNADAHFTRASMLEKNTAQFGKTHAQAAYIRPFLVKISALIKKAKADALAGVNKGIHTALKEGERLLKLAKTYADAEVLYRAHRATTEAGLKALSAPAIEFIDKEYAIEDINILIEAADEASKEFKHKKAEEALGKADTSIMTCNISAKAKSGTPTNKADIKKLLEQPGGQKALDELVATLPASTQQDVIKNVLEVRFGMKVNIFSSDKKADEGKAKKGAALDVPAPRLLDYYEVLKSVPATHTKLNPSLLQFDSIEEDKGGFYNSDDKRVAIQLDTKGDVNMAEHIGDPDELDNIDADSVCPSLGPDEPNQASWTTYHEIGHAVDDRKSFMDGKAKNVDFGGWIEYGSNIAPAAAAAAAQFEFDPSFVERTMAGGKPKTPDIPPDLQEKEGDNASKVWQKRQDNFEKWFKAVSVGSKPWAKASIVNEHKINGVMYQEAYSNNWVSYLADARKKGISGYQFRAPGEWFAELYAGYHTKKLSSSHPANSWLATL